MKINVVLFICKLCLVNTFLTRIIVSKCNSLTRLFSKTSDSGIIKTSIQPSTKAIKKYPTKDDSVDIIFKIFRSDGSLAHDSSTLDEPFRFKIEATPSDVIPAWDICIQEMIEGEIASFKIPYRLAFGEEGLPEPISIAPREDITCEIQLLRIIPPLSKQYKAVEYNESIKEEIAETINNSQKDSYLSSKDKAKKAEYFDPQKHKIDPNQMIKGQGRGHSWEENSRTIDIKIPLKQYYSKQDMLIDIQASSIAISDVTTTPPTILFSGPLHGKIVPSESTWAIIRSPVSEISSTGTFSSSQNNNVDHVLLSLQKCYGYQEIWATVLDRTYLQSINNDTTNNDNDTDDDDDDDDETIDRYSSDSYDNENDGLNQYKNTFQ